MRNFTVGSIIVAFGLGLAPLPAVADSYKCVYVAKKRGGLGDRVPDTRGVKEVNYGPNAPRERKVKKRLKACAVAKAFCDAKLRARQIKGKNPNAKCVVVKIKKDD